MFRAPGALTCGKSPRLRTCTGDERGPGGLAGAAFLTELVPATDDDRRLFRAAQAFETHALTRPELAEQLRQGYDDLIALLTTLTGPAARELLALGLANLTLTGNLTPEQARAIVRSGIEKRRGRTRS